MGCDTLDRPTSATGAYGNETYSYNTIGNITAKAGVTYTYGATAQTCNRLIDAPAGDPRCEPGEERLRGRRPGFASATGVSPWVSTPHAVTSTSDGKTYTYDYHGNLTADGSRTLTWTGTPTTSRRRSPGPA